MDERNLRTNQIAYVGPNGYDDNVGSQVHPFATIQAAVDDLRDSLAAGDTKVIRLLPGTYTESVVVNAENLLIEGLEDVVIKGDGNGPAVMATNMSVSGAEAYPGYTYTATGSFTYTGGATDQDALLGSDTELDFTLRGVTLQKGSSNQSLMVLPSEDGDANSVLKDVTFEDCVIEDEAVFKNVSGLTLRRTQVDTGATTVFDNCEEVNVDGAAGVSKSFGAMICRFQSSGLASEEVPGKNVAAESFFHNLDPSVVWGYARLYCQEAGSSLRNHGAGLSLVCNDKDGNGDSIFTAGAGHVGQLREGSGALVGKVGPFVCEDSVTLGAAQQWVDRLECEALNYGSSGTTEVESAYVDGDLNVSSGILKIYGGRIKGNVWTMNSAEVELYNCTVDGQLDADGSSKIHAHQCRVGGKVITEANCTINCHGCHAEGDVDATNGTINFEGGSFEGTDVDGSAESVRTN